MKKTAVLLFIFAIIFSIGISASALTASECGLNYNLPEEYTEFTNGGAKNHTASVQALGYTVNSLNSYFEKESVVLFALTRDNARQIIAKCTQTDFSLELGDLSLLDDQTIYSVGENLKGGLDVSGYAVINIGKARYFSMSSTQSDGNGQFGVVQYITVKNGKIYTFSFVNNTGEADSEFVDQTTEIMKTVNIRDLASGKKSTRNIFTVILVWILIVIAVAVAVFSIYLFIKDIGNRSEDDTTVTINRKKYGKK